MNERFLLYDSDEEAHMAEEKESSLDLTRAIQA